MELLSELADLNHILRNRSVDEYWERATELLRRQSGAQALSLWLFGSHSTNSQVSVRAGDFTEAWLVRIQRWEEALRSHSSSEFQMVSGDDVELGMGRREGDQPIVHVRLRMDGILLGGVSFIFDDESHAETDNYSGLLKMTHLFMDNGLRSRQLDNTMHKLDKMSLIAQVGQSLNSSLELDTVLQEATEMSYLTLQAQAATLFLVDSRTSELVFYMPTGSAGGLLREMRIPQNQGIAGWAATNRESLIVNDVKNDPRFSSQVDEETGFATHSILCVPLTVQGRTVGVLEVLNKEGSEGFTQEDATWLEKIGNQAAIALDNARLYQNLRNEQDRIINAQEEVRHQLARDLHDGAAQMLSLIILNVDVTRRLLDRERYDTVRSELDLLEDLGRQANREIRTLLFELRPIILESRGLIPALRSYTEQLRRSMSISIHIEADDLPFTLKPKAANNIFSIMQEAINNIRKHAQARNVWLRVRVEEDKLHFSVEDDGKGFDIASTRERYDDRGSFGLLNMHERVEMMDGHLSIESPSPRTNRGSLIAGVVPVESVQQKGGLEPSFKMPG